MIFPPEGPVIYRPNGPRSVTFYQGVMTSLEVALTGAYVVWTEDGTAHDSRYFFHPGTPDDMAPDLTARERNSP